MRLLVVVAGVVFLAGASTQEDPDFAVQGEYLGMAINPESRRNEMFGIQVIALGGGKFRAVAHWGGLPGEGWVASEKKDQWEGERQDGVPTIRAGNVTLTIENRELTISKGTRLVGKLDKVDRESPTIGKKPPEGAVVLFDGTEGSLASWKKGARRTRDGLLMQGVTSERTFGDHTLHLEFRLPYAPTARGQARGNSGLYVQGRYEVQMLDSFGLEGRNNECGGIYGVKAPDLNMCYPPMRWQTYDVEFTAARFDESGKKTAPARMTVRHNGVIIHKNVEVRKHTRAAPVKEGPGKGPGKGPVYLQNHGNPVRYRNIWVVERK